MATIWTVYDHKVVRSDYPAVLAKWHFKTGTTTASFNVYWEYWSTETKMWMLASGSGQSVPTSSIEGGWFQTEWTPPTAITVTKVRIWIDPVPKKGSSWKHKGVYTEPIPNPSYEEAVGDALDAPDADAEWLSDGSAIEVSWDDTHELWGRVRILRSTDGGAFALLAEVGPDGPYRDTSVSPGHSYRYEVQAVLTDGMDGAASSPTLPVRAEPAAPTDLSARCASVSGSAAQVRLDWQDSGTSGDSYVIEWSGSASAWDEHADPDGTDDYTGLPDASGRNHRTIEVTGYDPGATVWFRLRRRQSDNPENRELSGWAKSGSAVQVSCVLGATPAAPTLGAVPSSVALDEQLTISWTHNTEDGSPQAGYQVLLNGTTTLSGMTAQSVAIVPSDYVASDGGALTWQVRTKGVTDAWSDWSGVGTTNAWARPVAGISVASTVDALPLEMALSAEGSAAGNLPTRYWLGVYAAEGHRATLADGTEGWVAEGDCAWYGEAVPGDEGCDSSGWEVSLGAADVRLDAGCAYTVTGGCATAQGMTCDAEPTTIQCALGGDVTGCDADVSIDQDGLFATIWPTCTDGPDGSVRTGVTLSVWRLDPDGTELVASGLAPDGSVPCHDLHPPLGMARYRIVATDTATGAQGASDVEIEWGCPGFVIQWDESLSIGEDGTPTLSARRVILPYNVRVSRRLAKDASLRKWDGHRYPVSRYGDHVDDSATWSLDIDRADRDQYDALVELGGLMRDVHVRDPFGASYWAMVDVGGIDGGYDRAATNVSLTVTRVEG